jgi:FkbM family methyltransferase
MNRRIGIAKHWFFTNKNSVGLTEIVKNVFDATCTEKAKKIVTKVEQDEHYYIVYLKNVEYPVYYPIDMPLKSLWQVISESFYPSQWHFYEIPETKVSKNDVVVDCGAAEGLFGLLVANRCSKVYAIEPLPSFVKALQCTFKHFKNVDIMPLGLGDFPGIAYMDDNSIASSIGTEGNTCVKIETLDNLFYEQGIAVSYLKADLEGFEMNMLKGAVRTIKANKPKIAITTYHKKEHAQEIEALLKEIHPTYQVKVKGIEDRNGAPVMLHAW